MTIFSLFHYFVDQLSNKKLIFYFLNNSYDDLIVYFYNIFLYISVNIVNLAY